MSGCALEKRKDSAFNIRLDTLEYVSVLMIIRQWEIRALKYGRGRMESTEQVHNP